MKIITVQVLAGAYKGKSVSDRTLLTHSMVVDDESEMPVEDKSLCRKMLTERLADACSAFDEGDLAKPPTCPGCLARDPRHGGKLPRSVKVQS